MKLEIKTTKVTNEQSTEVGHSSIFLHLLMTQRDCPFINAPASADLISTLPLEMNNPENVKLTTTDTEEQDNWEQVCLITECEGRKEKSPRSHSTWNKIRTKHLRSAQVRHIMKVLFVLFFFFTKRRSTSWWDSVIWCFGST